MIFLIYHMFCIFALYLLSWNVIFLYPLWPFLPEKTLVPKILRHGVSRLGNGFFKSSCSKACFRAPNRAPNRAFRAPPSCSKSCSKSCFLSAPFVLQIVLQIVLFERPLRAPNRAPNCAFRAFERPLRAPNRAFRAPPSCYFSCPLLQLPAEAKQKIQKTRHFVLF